MAQCIWCENKGVFLKTNHAGLCKNCVIKIGGLADTLQKDIELSQKRIKNANAVGSAVGGRKTIENVCDVLKPYEEKGIDVYNLPLSEIYNVANEECNKKIVEIVKNSLGRDLLKLESAKTDKAYHKYYEQSLVKLDEAIEEIQPVENYQKSIDTLNAVKNQFEINFNNRFK
jgi:hypothetical protein